MCQTDNITTFANFQSSCFLADLGSGEVKGTNARTQFCEKSRGARGGCRIYAITLVLWRRMAQWEWLQIWPKTARMYPSFSLEDHAILPRRTGLRDPPNNGCVRATWFSPSNPCQVGPVAQLTQLWFSQGEPGRVYLMYKLKVGVPVA